jgi:hypothetical protein
MYHCLLVLLLANFSTGIDVHYFKVGPFFPGLWIRIRIGSGFNDFVVPDP